MPYDRATPDGTIEAFRKQIRMADGRYRLERLSQKSWPLAWTVAVALLALLLVALMTPVAAWAAFLALGLLAMGLAAAFVVFRIGPDRHRLLVRMDTHSKLPDSVLSAGDWERSGLDPWRERQRNETLQRLEKIDWRAAWPVRWPRLLWLPLASAALLTVVVWIVQQNWLGQERRAAQLLAQENAPLTPEQLKPLEQVFADWDNAEKIAPSPDLEKMLREIKPTRDAMASGQMTEKDLFLKLNDIQARLQAEQDKLDQSSLEPLAQSMAAAVQDLDGMSGLAAALERKDFAAARDQAAQAQQNYQSGAAQMPNGDNAQNAANQLGNTAQQAANNPQASSAMHEMQNAISNKNSSGMSHGLGGLKNALAQQSQRQGQCHCLGTQMAQLSSCKNGMCHGNGTGIAMGMPHLTLSQMMQQQKGAGTGVDPNRFGAQTQLDSNHQEMKITGTAGDGNSETQTESTTDPHQEQTASAVSAAQFQQYEKLSEQAADDENLPVADRQTIKRYFEDIRPSGNP